MAQSVFPAPSSSSTVGLDGILVGASGTYTLPKTYPAGIYKLVTESSQAMTLTFDNTGAEFDGFPSFSQTIRGGYGFVNFPYDVNTITVPGSLSYGFLITLDQLNTPAQIAAPTNHAVTWNSTKTQITGTWTSVPANTQTVTFYYVVAGTVYNVNFNSTTSGATATISTAPPASAGLAYGILCTNTAGVRGVMGTGTTGAVPSATTTVQFTSTTTWTSPFTGSLTDVLVVAGGGRGGGSGVPGAGGGGGAGGYRTSTSQTVVNGTTYAVTVGAAGGGSSSWNATGLSSQAAFSASGGGNGTGSRGGSGGGGAGNGYGGSGGGTGNIGGYTPAEGTNGQGVGSSTDRGSGGGLSASNSITGTAVTYSIGGNGGGSTYGSGGYGGGYNGGDPGGSGVQGTVVIKYSF